MNAKADTWMPLYIGDYLRDTGHLGAREHGAYLLLIMHQWTTGVPLPVDDRQLARVARLDLSEWKRVRPLVEPFFQKDAAGWTHGRVMKELSIAAARSQKAREKAGKRWSHDAAADATASPLAKPVDCYSNATAGAAVNAASMPGACSSPSPSPSSSKSSVSNETADVVILRDPNKLLFDEGSRIFGNNSNGLTAKIKKFANGDATEALRIVRQCDGKANPREYAGAIMRNPEAYDDKFYYGVSV